MEPEARLLPQLLDDIRNNRLMLPTLPEVAIRVRDAVEDENATAAQITRIVGTDAALSARLIQVANSPLYRGRSAIQDLQQAIARLGNKLVRNLVTSLVMQQIFQATDDVLDRRLHALWEHSVQVAAISRALAGPYRHLVADQALLAGLVHDIGALPILVRAEEYPELLEDEDKLDRVVRSLHGEVGQMILESWGFPPEMSAVPAEHDNLLRDPGPGARVDYVDIVLVANLQSYIGTDHPHTRADWSAVPAFARMGLQPEINVIEVENTAEAVEETQRLLGR